MSEQAARLLLWTWFKCLALIIEKFSLTYYANICGKKVHVPRYLSMHKWFFDDLPRFGLKMWYLFITTDKKSPMIPFSIGLGLSSLWISFVSFTIATTSILSNENLQKLKASGVILNFSKEKEEQEDNEAPEERDIILYKMLLLFIISSL